MPDRPVDAALTTPEMQAEMVRVVAQRIRRDWALYRNPDLRHGSGSELTLDEYQELARTAVAGLMEWLNG